MCANVAYGFWKKRSTVSSVHYLVKKVKETVILINKLKQEKPKPLSTSESIAAVAEIVCEAPSTSIQITVVLNK